MAKNTALFSFPCGLCGRKQSWEVSEAEKKHLEDMIRRDCSPECFFCNEHLTSRKEGVVYRKVSPEKLSYLVDELRRRNIMKPTKNDVEAIFTSRGWTIKNTQAWRYKKMAEAELQ